MHISSLLLSKVFELTVVLVRHFLGVHAFLLGRCVVIIEITCVGWMAQVRDDWAFLLAIVERFPVHRGEKGVRLHPVNTAGEIAQTMSRIYDAEAGDEIASVGVESRGEFEFAFADPTVVVECQ